MAEKHQYKYKDATILTYQQSENDMTYARFTIISGARCDEKGKEGTAHIFEHYFFKGDFEIKTKDENGNVQTTKLNTKDFYRYLKSIGAEIDAYTSNDAISIVIKAPNKYFDETVSIAKQMWSRKFDESTLQKEKKVVNQEILMTLDEKGINSLQANRSGKTKSKILGTPYSLNRITVADLENFQKKRLIRDNMVISVVSSLPFEKIKDAVEKDFLDYFPSNAKRKITLKVKSYDIKEGLESSDIPYANSFDIEFVFKGLDGVEKNDLMTRFEDWYFNDFAGKLFEKLRIDNQLVYASNFVNVPVRNSNLKAFVVKTSPENANRCVEVLTEILRDVIKNGVSEEDFEAFKQSMREERARKSNTKFMDVEKMGDDYIYGKQVFVKDFFNKLMDLKREDVNKYLKDIYGNSKLFVYYEGDLIKAENVKFIEQNGVLKPIDKMYPVNVVSDEQLVKDYLGQVPLYSHEEILDMYKYWDEVQLLELKRQMDEEFLESAVLSKQKTIKVPKVTKKQVEKAALKTYFENMNKKESEKFKEEDENTLELKK